VISLLKRFREPIFVIALLAFPFVLFFARAKKGRELNPVDRAVLTFTAPAEKLITWAAFSVVDGWQGYVALRSVRRENLDLRRERIKALAAQQQTAELRLENERLKRLLDYTDKQTPTRMVTAKVIAVGASPHSHSLRIARGSDDGVVKGAAVLSPDGVVGTVALITGGYSDVQLIVSPLSAVSAMSQRTRSRSTVKGTGDYDRCKLEYALRTADLQEGDVLITPGGGYFPPGTPIGKVTNVAKKPAGMFLDAQVVPAVDFSRLDEVVVVVQATQAPPAIPHDTPAGPGTQGSGP
jgi:rod shape-determining protein MreC